uniref:Peptidase S1 domain-containing protein n=1 Tax=Panagrolaimus davidi TaxID=227884 RepID=A0A914QQH2_9BILA
MAAEKLILFFAAIFLFQQNAYGFNQNRIVNGTATPDDVFEFVPRYSFFMAGNSAYSVSKYGMRSSFCSSTVISKRHILTAAHCLVTNIPINKNSTINPVHRVQAIAVEFRRKGKGIAEVFKDNSFQTRYYFHPAYSYYNWMFADIAIIEFPEGTNLNITPITLASNYVEKKGDMGIAAGYGVYKVKINEIDGKEILEYPTILQNVTLPIHPPIDCLQPSFVLCTISHESYTYYGDSGGPLMIERNGKLYQIGITSSGRTKNGTRFEAYTRIAIYCNWIYNVTKGEVDCEKLPEESNVKP